MCNYYYVFKIVIKYTCSFSTMCAVDANIRQSVLSSREVPPRKGDRQLDKQTDSEVFPIYCLEFAGTKRKLKYNCFGWFN